MSDLLPTIVLAAAVLAGLVLWLNLGLQKLTKELSKRLPSDSWMRHLIESQKALTQSLDAERNMVQQLPQHISEPVSRGLQPLGVQVESQAAQAVQALGALTEHLDRSHDVLTGAVVTLDREGSLGDWVASLRDTVQPLRTLSESVDQHYSTAGEILTSVSRLVDLWAEEREAVVDSFRRFSEQVERSAAAETTHLRDIEHRLMARLSETADTNARISHALSELEVASGRAMESHEGLAQSVEQTVLRVGELLDLGSRTQKQQQELIRGQQKQQADLAQWHAKVTQSMTDLREQLAAIGSDAQAVAEKVSVILQRSASKVESLVTESAQAQQTAFGRWQEGQKALETRQRSVLDKAHQLIAEWQGATSMLPDRSQISVLLGLQAGQLVLLGLLVYGMFQIL